jgi:hypothetical protein
LAQLTNVLDLGLRHRVGGQFGDAGPHVCVSARRHRCGR